MVGIPDAGQAERGTVRADDFLVLADVEEHVRMVVRRGCPDTHEFLGADFDHRHARIIVEVGDNVFRHGNSSC
jgi:hypothetical protein